MGSKVATARHTLTPLSNTGSNGKPPQIVARCHWLQGTFGNLGRELLNDLMAAIVQTFGDEFAVTEGVPAFHGIRYDNSAQSGHGIRLAWNMPNGDEPGRAWLGIPGSALDLVGADAIHYLGQYLCYTLGMKVTRYDAAIDDFKRRVDPDHAIWAAMHGFLHGTKQVRMAGISHQGKMAVTAYFGATSSDKIVRCYDKFIESEGEINAIRWEVQFRDELAHTAFIDFLTSGDGQDYDGMARCLARQVTGAIDFKDPSSGRRAADQKRVSWWQQLQDEAGGAVRISVTRIKSSLAAKLRWLERQVAPCLAQIYDLSALQFNKIVKTLRQKGRTRLTSAHHAQNTAFLGLHPERRAAILEYGLAI